MARREHRKEDKGLTARELRNSGHDAQARNHRFPKSRLLIRQNPGQVPWPYSDLNRVENSLDTRICARRKVATGG
jgi:hypothetical protein